MDGRDFMTGNNDAVMKNLPSYVVDQVKAYDEKSDLSRMTGLDDGNDDFVLEFVTKRSARKGIQANPDVGIGTDGRYGIRLTAMKPFGAMRYTFMGNANNVNDRNFSGRGGRGRGNGQGQRETKTAALDASYENGKNLKWSGRVTWNHGDTDNWNKTASESFVNTRGGAFSNSISQNYSRNNNWTGNMNLQWNIDSVTTLSFRPDVSYQTSDSRNFSTSAAFNADPYGYVTDPLSSEGLQTMREKELAVNSRQNKGLGYNDNANVNAQLQIFRRLGSKGRNIAISSQFSWRDGSSQNASLSAVHLYQQKDKQGNDSTYQTNRYTSSANKQLSYSLGVTYTEPLLLFKTSRETEASGMPGMPEMRGPFGGRGGGGGRNRGGRSFGQQGLFLQLNYRYRYDYQKNDPSTYDFPKYTDEAFANVLNEYREWQTTSNSIGNIVTYNEKTGGRITRPENINGNWNASLGVGFNIGLDTLNRWDISGSINGRYDHRIGYVNLNRTAEPDRNVTHTYNLSPEVSLSFRNSWFSFSLNERTTYARTENRLQASNNLTTWNFSYGGNTKITFPWGSNLSTDFHVFSKRGYSDETLNTNELIWNAQLSHSFLRGKVLTVMLQWYDILHEQTTFSRMVNANGWRDQEVNAITSYAMLHVSYRLNFFGQGSGRGGGRPGGF